MVMTSVLAVELEVNTFGHLQSMVVSKSVDQMGEGTVVNPIMSHMNLLSLGPSSGQYLSNKYPLNIPTIRVKEKKEGRKRM